MLTFLALFLFLFFFAFFIFFSDVDYAPWDVEKKYIVDDLVLYFHDPVSKKVRWHFQSRICFSQSSLLLRLRRSKEGVGSDHRHV